MSTKKHCLRGALCAMLCLAAFAPSVTRAADGEDAREYLYTCDFEHLTTATMTKESAINYARKSSEITIETLDGSNVLCFRHRKTDTSEDCFIDVLPAARSWGIESAYCFSYDFRFTATSSFTWQVLCSRQTPASGTQFQQVGYVTDGTLTVPGSSYTLTLEADRWYRFTAAVDEAENRFDLYLDGVLLAEAVPFSIADSSELYPDRLRIGFGGSVSEAVAYVDNICIYNASVPYDVASPEVIVVSSDARETVADFPLPVYVSEAGLSQTVWYILGSAASLALALIGYGLIRRLRRS